MPNNISSIILCYSCIGTSGIAITNSSPLPQQQQLEVQAQKLTSEICGNNFDDDFNGIMYPSIPVVVYMRTTFRGWQ